MRHSSTTLYFLRSSNFNLPKFSVPKSGMYHHFPYSKYQQKVYPLAVSGHHPPASVGSSDMAIGIPWPHGKSHDLWPNASRSWGSWLGDVRSESICFWGVKPTQTWFSKPNKNKNNHQKNNAEIIMNMIIMIRMIRMLITNDNPKNMITTQGVPLYNLPFFLPIQDPGSTRQGLTNKMSCLARISNCAHSWDGAIPSELRMVSWLENASKNGRELGEKPFSESSISAGWCFLVQSLVT